MIFTYNPLPPMVKIIESDIHGLGIGAKEYIPENTYIGISHVVDDKKTGLFHANLIRQPLGGFINHSESPNCTLDTKGREWHLWSVEEIYENYELTLDYRLFPCGYEF